MKILQNILQKIRQFWADAWERTSSRDRLRYLIIAVIALVLIIGSLAMLNTGRYVPLADDMTETQLAATRTALSEQNIPMRTADGGRTVLVNRNRFEDAVVAISQSQEAADVISFETYLNATGIMSTAEDKRFFKEAFMEEELTRMLRRFDGISHAEVSLNLQDNSRAILQTDERESSASVAVWFHEDADRSRPVIDSIATFIGNSADIAPENIAVLDGMTTRNLNSQETDFTTIEYHHEIERQYSAEMVHAVTRLLAPVLGENYFQVTADARLSFDTVTRDIVEFSPVVDDEGIPRSMHTINENATGTGPRGWSPGMDPNGAGDVYTEVDADQINTYSNIVTTINYEINQINTRVEEALGSLTDLTISLLVDNQRFEQNAANANLLISAVGGAVGLLESDWGNRIQVNFAEFAGMRERQEAEAEMQAALARERLFNFLQIILLYVVIGVCIILLGWRTLSLFKPKEVILPAESGDYLVGDLAEYSELVDSAVQSIGLEVSKTPSRERVEEFIDDNPDAVASMLRNWLQDEGAPSW